MKSRSKMRWQYSDPKDYQRHNDAVARRTAEHFKHMPGPRVDLPGQLELPQTEARPTELAKRQAAAPMRPTTAQKPMDIGLFSDTANQIDMEDML